MEERRYFFPRDLQAVAETSGIADIAEKLTDAYAGGEEEDEPQNEEIFNPYSYCHEEPWLSDDEESDRYDRVVEDFCASAEFGSFNPSERVESLKAYRLTPEESW